MNLRERLYAHETTVVIALMGVGVLSLPSIAIGTVALGSILSWMGGFR